MTHEAMKITRSILFVFGVLGAAATLEGCGGSQINPSAPTQSVAESKVGANPDHRRSWMAPDAAPQDLLYVSDLATYDVNVYSYPGGKMKGRLTGFGGPEGECVDATGHVFITNFGASNILEYAHGGTSPIATLNDPGYYPVGCSVDVTTGNLAVANYVTTSGAGQGGVVIYKQAKGSPKIYTEPKIVSMSFCGYDDAGNLFVDGLTSDNAFAFAELSSGGTSLKNIVLNQKIGVPGGIQWDGSHVTVGDRSTNVIYQFTITGTNGKKAGSTHLTGASEVNQFWIDGLRVIGSDPVAGNVKFWNYPTGGSSAKTITGLVQPVGATVSLHM